MFGKKQPKRRKSSFGLFRLLLSLMMICLLLGGFYLAFKTFSGIDPMHINSGRGLKNILASDKFFNLVNGLLSLDPKKGIDQLKTNLGAKSSPTAAVANPDRKMLFRFAVVTDSHNDNEDLKKALTQAKAASSQFVIGLGDYTDVGTVDELRNAKSQFEIVGISYYSTAGDHDLWDSRDKKLQPATHYTENFGSPYSSFSYQNVRMIILFNSDNYEGVDGVQMKWLQDELEQTSQDKPRAIMIFLSTPLFHPSSDHVMGKENPNLKNQASDLIQLFKKYHVNLVVAGDTHFFSDYTEPISNLKMVTVGAITSTRNLQNPRFALIDVYDDGSYNIQDTEIK